MAEELLVKYCAPTLAGLKTGNVFSCSFEDEKSVEESLKRWNDLLQKKGLCIIQMRYKEKNALIYAYRPNRLVKDLQQQSAKNILREKGYCIGDCKKCLMQLIKRMSLSEDFPHEIGLFLGYPPEDVKGFIEGKASNYKSTGYWKVYGDVDKAEKLFAKYRKCTDVYCKQFNNGLSLERLTVAG